MPWSLLCVQVSAASCPFLAPCDTALDLLIPTDLSGPLWRLCLLDCFSTLWTGKWQGGGARVAWWGKSWILWLIWYVIVISTLQDLIALCIFAADDHFGFRRWKETSEFNRLLSCSRDPKFRSASIKSGREVHSVPILTHHSPFRSPSESPPPSAPLLSACEPLSTRYYSRSLSFVASPASPVSTSPLPTCLKTQLGNPSILKGHQSRRA